jgi:hypothetical protein
MVVGEIRAKQAAEMPIVEDDHVVQKFAADGAAHALYVGILPRGERTRHDLGDAEAGDPPTHLIVVDAVPVSQQPSGSGVLGEGFDQLLGGPRGGGVLGDVDARA